MINKDGSDNQYIDIQDTIRLTYVRSSNRPKGTDWAEGDVIRFSAYKEGNRSLHPGPELPIKSSSDVYELITAICQLCGGNNPS